MRKALDQGNGKSDGGLYLGYLLPKWKEGGGADRRSAAYTGRRGGICEGSRVACALVRVHVPVQLHGAATGGIGDSYVFVVCGEWES